MGKVIAEISVSLDGYVAGPNPTDEEPLGAGGEQLHEWVLATSAWRDSHGREGGDAGVDSDVVEELNSRIGTTIMGRKMFSGGSGPWEGDSNASGWWGDEPPFGHPVLVLTHHEREPLELGATTFNFVTGGVEEAHSQAQEAAGDSDIRLAGGGEAIQAFMAAGLVDEVVLHLVPVTLGGGAPLFDGETAGALELTRMVESPTGVAHLFYSPTP